MFQTYIILIEMKIRFWIYVLISIDDRIIYPPANVQLYVPLVPYKNDTNLSEQLKAFNKTLLVKPLFKQSNENKPKFFFYVQYFFSLVYLNGGPVLHLV